MDIKATLAELKKNWVICSLVVIGLGLMLLLFPGSSLRAVCYIAGGFSVAFGVIRTVRYFQEKGSGPFMFQSDLLAGLICLGVGLFMLGHAETVMGLVPTLFGVVLVGCGIGGIVRAVEAKKAGVSKWGILLALAILTVVLGAVILSDPFSALETAIMVIGAGLIYEGATDLITAMVAGKRIEDWRKSEKP